jgi:transcriptional regulator with XRE-family HTH domain
MTLGENIQQLRKAGGFSQEQLAEMIGVSRQAISKWETDQSQPEIEKLILLSKVFSVSTDELLGNAVTVNTEAAAPQMSEVIRANTRKRQFTLGWITVVIGLILLICDFIALLVIQFIEKQYFGSEGYWGNPLEYAFEPPMPVIFAITAVIILLGIGLVVASFISASQLRR